MHESTIIQRALLSVFDKENIIELAEILHLHGVELLSTGNTAVLLKEHGLPVITVGEYTGFPEIMQGRVKTLHPKIHGGILGRRDVDAEIMHTHNIPDIDLVVVNLYPFEKVRKNPLATFEDIIENIDIGGPTMIRAAAKNYQWCTVMVDPNDYAQFIQEFKENHGVINDKTRFHFATKAFAHTAAYDANISNFLSKGETLTLQYQLKEKLRYGENPHQTGAFYQLPHPPQDSISNTTQLQGKALSYNNIQDGDTALECVKTFTENACVIVKHANPCGVAIAQSAIEAYEKAYNCDPTSAFGGIIAFNHPVDDKLLAHIFSKQFVEVLIAPHFTQEALALALQKAQCRLLQYHTSDANNIEQYDIKSVNGGILVQSWHPFIQDDFQVVSGAPTEAQLKDLHFSWHVARFVKSNAIVFAKNGQTLGIGAGQMSRIFSTEIAALKASQVDLNLENAVMASDAFFPFPDNVEKAHSLGVKAIIQPGGSMRDEQVIARAKELGMAMVFTGTRFFRH